jgi:hypothetical protein
MKLQDLYRTEGTYVGLTVLPESKKLLSAFVKLHQIGKPPSQLHATVIYSRKKHDIKVDPDAVYEATFKDYTIFQNDDGSKTLVALLHCPLLVARHLQLMAKYSATYDHPVYHPHVSLCYNFTGDEINLPPMTFPILLSQEYTEPLDLDYK